MDVASMGLGAAALVLAAAGALKGADPRPTADALRAAGLPLGPSTGRRVGTVIGILEVAASLGALVAVGVPGALVRVAVLALYLGFAVLTLLVRSSGEAATCGCFGAQSGPPDRWHLALDLVLAATALLALATAAPAPVSLVTADVSGMLAGLAMLVASVVAIGVLARPAPSVASG
jgi:hypothetical protein